MVVIAITHRLQPVTLNCQLSSKLVRNQTAGSHGRAFLAVDISAEFTTYGIPPCGIAVMATPARRRLNAWL